MQTKRLIVKARRTGEIGVLDIQGRLEDGINFDILQNAVIHSLSTGQNHILINLAKVSYIEPGCLKKLSVRQTTLKNKAGKIKFVQPSAGLMNSQIKIGLKNIGDIYETETEAVESFRTDALILKTKKQSLFPDTCYKKLPLDWGLTGMSITFRSELMPKKSRLKRTFTIKELLPSGCVVLNEMTGKYVKEVFETVQYSIS